MMLLTLQVRDKEISQPVDAEIDGGFVKLGPLSIAVAERVGTLRNDLAGQLGRPPAHGYDQSNDLLLDRQGAYSELAVAAFTGKKWNAILDVLRPNFPDVGDDIQVKNTHYPQGKLIAHRDSLDTDRYVLTIWNPKEPSVIKLVGWQMGAVVKREEYWTTFTGRPCFMAPQFILRPMQELIG